MERQKEMTPHEFLEFIVPCVGNVKMTDQLSIDVYKNKLQPFLEKKLGVKLKIAVSNYGTENYHYLLRTVNRELSKSPVLTPTTRISKDSYIEYNDNNDESMSKVYGKCPNCGRKVALGLKSPSVKKTNKNDKIGLGTAIVGLGSALMPPLGIAIGTAVGVGGLLYGAKSLFTDDQYTGKCPYCGSKVGLNDIDVY